MTAGEATTEEPRATPSKKPMPGKPWSDQETAHLIEVYETRWYALKRGQLKAHQWEEVAAAVAARLGLAEPSKSGTQCRHKLEKLRKRYRDERQRAAPSRWLFFDRMDRMERGPLPISVRPPPPPPPSDRHHLRPAGDIGHGDDEEEDNDDDDDEEDDDDEDLDGDGDDGTDMEEGWINGNSRKINGILGEGDWSFPRVSRNPRFGEEDGGEGEVRMVGELAAVVRRFREGFARLEKRRLELMREMERDWMETEAKRAEMVIESQRFLVDTIARAFHSSKKPKNSHEM